jgi:hypothetical protein
MRGALAWEGCKETPKTPETPAARSGTLTEQRDARTTYASAPTPWSRAYPAHMIPLSQPEDR